MSNKIKVALTEKQFLAIHSRIFYYIQDMQFERENDGIAQPELRVLVNGYNAMTEGLEKWKN